MAAMVVLSEGSGADGVAEVAKPLMVPLSDDGHSVFIDGFGEVPLAYPSGVEPTAPALPVDRLEQIIDAYLEEYEMVGEAPDGRDACHQPSPDERALIKDAILGLLANEEWDAEWGKLIEQRARALGVAAADGGKQG